MRLLQLALLLALRDDLLPGPGTRAVAFDPAYDAFDRGLLEALGVEVMAEDVGCRHVADAPCLVYMPTCERQLYDALLVRRPCLKLEGGGGGMKGLGGGALHACVAQAD